jgi:hypothetical protein
LWNRDPDRDPSLTEARRAEALDDFATEFDAYPGPWTPEWEHAS